MEFVGRRKSCQAASITPSPAQRVSPCTTAILLRKIGYKNNKQAILPLSPTHITAESKRASDPNTAPGTWGQRVLSRRGKKSHNLAAASPSEEQPQDRTASSLPLHGTAKQGESWDNGGYTFKLLLFLLRCLFGERGASTQESLDQGSANPDVLFNFNAANINSLMQGKPRFLKYFQVKPFITGGRRLCGDAIIIQNKALKAKETQNYH